MTARTDIQILKLRLPLLVKVAEITVPRGIETSIQKTALEEDEFIALGDRLINEIFFGFGAEIVVVKARTRIDNAAGLPFFIGLASFQVLATFCETAPLASSAVVAGNGSPKYRKFNAGSLPVFW